MWAVIQAGAKILQLHLALTYADWRWTTLSCERAIENLHVHSNGYIMQSWHVPLREVPSDCSGNVARVYASKDSSALQDQSANFELRM